MNRRRLRTAIVMLLLGALTSAASAVLIAYWPRSGGMRHEQIDRDRHPADGEGRGYLSMWYQTGFGYQTASGTASQQFIPGGYNYASNTDRLTWPGDMGRRAAPWLSGDQPWPVDGVSRQTIVLRVGWPLPMLEGAWSQKIGRQPRLRPLAPQSPPEEPDSAEAEGNAITTDHWLDTRNMWSPYGGWAYIHAPNWLRSSRLGSMLFNKVQLQAIPTRPLWGGVIVNTALFALAWWGVVSLVGRARRAIKEARTHGRCEWCRYPRAGLAADAPCPECGKRPGRDSNPRPAV